MTVSNACLGTCDSPNHPPTARAQAVTVAAGPACTADASIDNGSSDPDGDPLTLVQSPAAPYAQGTTSPVLLTVTDPKGAFGQASGSVTVVDQTGPAINRFEVSPTILWPPNGKMVDVDVMFHAVDNCSAASCVLTVSSNEGTPDDWHVVGPHHVRLRAERLGRGPGRVYTLTLTCTDAAGNATARRALVFVPHNR